MYLVAGLGNPGTKYSGSRHNIGFMSADGLAGRLEGGEWKKGFAALYTEIYYEREKLLVLKPQTYMNRSGEAVREAARYYNIPADNVIVLHDEMDLPLGALKVKQGGGSAGHKGIISVTEHLGTPEFKRVRIGIGRPKGGLDSTAHVLGTFEKSQTDEVARVVEISADAVCEIIKNGIEIASNKYNKRNKECPLESNQRDSRIKQPKKEEV
ncbi:MAG: aminoacyl-tRNA hydrolase [Candidatus Dadabacteria bacterium]|nr:aminoacyl-tRNA hydrolase [Candidatus Dadabacteria bacterium]